MLPQYHPMFGANLNLLHFQVGCTFHLPTMFLKTQKMGVLSNTPLISLLRFILKLTSKSKLKAKLIQHKYQRKLCIFQNFSYTPIFFGNSFNSSSLRSIVVLDCWNVLQELCYISVVPKNILCRITLCVLFLHIKLKMFMHTFWTFGSEILQ